MQSQQQRYQINFNGFGFGVILMSFIRPLSPWLVSQIPAVKCLKSVQVSNKGTRQWSSDDVLVTFSGKFDNLLLRMNISPCN